MASARAATTLFSAPGVILDAGGKTGDLILTSQSVVFQTRGAPLFGGRKTLRSISVESISDVGCSDDGRSVRMTWARGGNEEEVREDFLLRKGSQGFEFVERITNILEERQRQREEERAREEARRQAEAGFRDMRREGSLAVWLVVREIFEAMQHASREAWDRLDSSMESLAALEKREDVNRFTAGVIGCAGAATQLQSAAGRRDGQHFVETASRVLSDTARSLRSASIKVTQDDSDFAQMKREMLADVHHAFLVSSWLNMSAFLLSQQMPDEARSWLDMFSSGMRAMQARQQLPADFNASDYQDLSPEKTTVVLEALGSVSDQVEESLTEAA